jgi:hypothetical protein
LRADDRADLVAVDIDIARMHPVNQMLDAPLDTRMQSKGQTVALF